MNKRIEELAKQAGIELDDDEALEFGKQIYYVTREDMEKFVDLIVRECAELADACEKMNIPVDAAKAAIAKARGE